MLRKWYRSKFNKIKKAWVSDEILSLDFPKLDQINIQNRRKWQPSKIVRFFLTYISHTYGTISPLCRVPTNNILRMDVTILYLYTIPTLFVWICIRFYSSFMSINLSWSVQHILHVRQNKFFLWKKTCLCSKSDGLCSLKCL